VQSDGVVLKKGQKSPIIKAIIVQYIIIATKSQLVKWFLKKSWNFFTAEFSKKFKRRKRRIFNLSHFIKKQSEIDLQLQATPSTSF